MRNQFNLILIISTIVFVGLGCGGLNPFSGGSGSSGNGTSTSDKAVDTIVSESKIGVPECDEVIDMLNAEMNSPDDNFVTKAIKATVLNRIKDGIRENIEQNKTDKVEMAKTCKEFKTQLEKFKAEQEANK